MTCKELIDILVDYVSEELEPEKQAEFDDHLAICPPCIVYIKTYRATIRIGKEAMRPPSEQVPLEIPESLVQAILAARRQA